VLYSLAYAVVRLLLEILIVRGGSAARLRIEVLVLRHLKGGKGYPTQAARA